MTREEAIQEFQNVKDLIRQDGKDWFDERDLELIDMAIEALSEPINCVKCKHYYETEDDTDVHGHCKMDTAHTNLISKEEAIEMLKALNMMLRNPNGEPISDVCDALDMAIEALQFVKHFDLLKEFQSLQEVVRCKDCVHFTGLNESKTWGRCNAHGRTAQDIDYCSWGEKKEE